MTDIDDIVFEVMLKEAVTANFRNKMNSMPSEEELLREFPPSAEYIRNMRLLFTRERRRTTLKKFLSVARAAAVYICILSTVLFALLMFNPHVRAAVRDAVVRFFDGFTRIEFNETSAMPKSVQSYAPEYIPAGYALSTIDNYEDSRLTVYADSDGNMLILDVKSSGTHMGDADNRDYRIETHEGIAYYIFDASADDYFSSITWTQDGYMFSLTGVIPIEELIKAALSVK